MLLRKKRIFSIEQFKFSALKMLKVVTFLFNIMPIECFKKVLTFILKGMADQEVSSDSNKGILGNKIHF